MITGFLAFLAAGVAAYFLVIVGGIMAASAIWGRDFILRHAWAFEAAGVVAYGAIMWGAAWWIF